MESESTVISFWQALPSSKSVMFAKVVSAMFLKAFLRKETLVACNDNVGKSEQARENIILYHLIRQVLEKQIGFLFIDIQPQVSNLPGFESCEHGLSINESTSAGVDQHDARLHLSQCVGVNKVQ